MLFKKHPFLYVIHFSNHSKLSKHVYSLKGSQRKEVFLREKIIHSFSSNHCVISADKTLFLTLVKREFNIDKLRPSKTEKNKLSLSLSVLNSLLIRVIKRVLSYTNHTVIIAKRVYDIFSYEYLYALRTLHKLTQYCRDFMQIPQPIML